MNRTAQTMDAVLSRVDGTQNVEVEKTTGLPFQEIKIDKAEIARRGLSLASVQDLIETAVGGRAAGLVFEGDRRFQIVVPLNDSLRNDIPSLENPPLPLPHARSLTPAPTLPPTPLPPLQPP